MLTIKALPDGCEEAMTLLGSLCPLENEPSQGISLVKKITVENIGSYRKKLHTPIYKGSVMSRLAVTDPHCSFDPTHCAGALCPGLSIPPVGYVVRSCGAHRFCLLVYETASISSAFYSIAGYMSTEEGFVAVCKRRTPMWCFLGLCSALIFVLSYLVLQHGAAGALDELIRLGGYILP